MRLAQRRVVSLPGACAAQAHGVKLKAENDTNSASKAGATLFLVALVLMLVRVARGCFCRHALRHPQERPGGV